MPKKPLKGETRQEYISRCIEYFEKVEKLPHKEAVGRAMGFASSYYGKRGKR